MFNYIITIHNKQDLLLRVLRGIEASCSRQSRIIPVLDGCTDRSEALVNEFIASTSLSVEKVITPDVYELRAINAGMARVTEGFVLTIQDDVILQEPELEQKVTALCANAGPSIGVISPRHGVNIRRMPLLRQFKRSGVVPLMDICDRVCRPEEAWAQSERLEYGQLIYRMAAVGSPMIIPEPVWRALGRFDEEMFSLMWFDIEYNLRALRAGFKNAVYPLRFESNDDWGTMRVKATDREWRRMVQKWSLENMRYVWKKHGAAIAAYHSMQGRPPWTFV
jgi:GT2 family glycosyltransferase